MSASFGLSNLILLLSASLLPSSSVISLLFCVLESVEWMEPIGSNESSVNSESVRIRWSGSSDGRLCCCSVVESRCCR